MLRVFGVNFCIYVHVFSFEEQFCLHPEPVCSSICHVVCPAMVSGSCVLSHKHISMTFP